jgi:hypothetical protein
MSARLGVSVSGDVVRGIVVRAGHVVWHGQSPIRDKETAAAALDRVLTQLPPTRIGRPSVRVVLGLASSQVKRLERLPPTRQPKLLDRIVKENADAFFLRLGTRTLVTGVERRADGSTWSAALDAALVEEVIGALRHRGLLPAGVMPFVVAVAHALPSATWRVADGGCAVALTTIEGSVIQQCRRDVAGASAPPRLDALNAVGPDGQEFAAAYGAAVARANGPFVWRPPRDQAITRALDVMQVAAAAVLFASTMTAALFARGIHASRVETAATAELIALRDSQIVATRADAELRRVSADLDRVHRFAAERGRTMLLMGALSEALPDSTALASLRVDSAEVSFVALAPRAAQVLPRLVDLPGAVAPRIVGSVTREVQGGARVERASFRFRRRSSHEDAR